MLRVLRLIGAILFWSFSISVLWVLLLRFVPPPVTWLMVEQANEQGSIEREWIRLEALPHAMPMAVIASEDQLFFDHFGISMSAIRKAQAYNEKKKGKRVKGASTISQQTAKNVFCWPQRSYVRKAMELGFTFLMECLWSKRRILEVYLNVAETGKGRFGVASVSRACFNRSASRITPAQAALITAALPLPRKRDVCKPSGYMLRRQADIQRQMRNLGDQMDPDHLEKVRQLREQREQRKAQRKRRK